MFDVSIVKIRPLRGSQSDVINLSAFHADFGHMEGKKREVDYGR